jgi:hypothetical protein
MVPQQRAPCWTDERVLQTMIHQESPILTMNPLLCSVSVVLALPSEALSLRLVVRCSVAEEQDRRQIGRWLVEAVPVFAEEEAGWSSGLGVVMLSVLFGPSPEPSSTATSVVSSCPDITTTLFNSPRRRRLLLE